MMHPSAFFLVAALLLLAPIAAARKDDQPAADLAVINGKVWTADAAHPRAEAVAIVGERIAAVGSNAEIQKWIGPHTRKIDAGGMTVIPGFVDAHVHFSSGGAEISGVQLRDAATPPEFARRIGQHARKLPKGEWILGGTWDHELWGGTLPVREWIDAVTPENPVLVSRYDGHMALANSLALRLAGVTRDTPAPAGGTIVRDAQGNPTGVLKDAAMNLVFRVVPPPSEAQRMRAARAALAEARRFGVTGVHDISSIEDVRVYQKLAASGELTLRIYCMTPIQQWEALARTAFLAGSRNSWIRVGVLKGFVDG